MQSEQPHPVPPSGGPLVDGVLADRLAAQLYLRSRALLEAPDPVRAGRCRRALGAELDRLRSDSGTIELLRGLFRADGFQAGGDVADRDAAAALFGAVLPTLPDDAPFLGEALAAYAYLLRGLGDADGAGVVRHDRAVAVLVRARRLLSAGDRPDLVLLEGELRCIRGDADSDPTELRRALDQLALFLRVAAPDDPDRKLCRWMQAAAHGRLWRLTGDPLERALTVACCDAAFAPGLPDVLTLDLHRLGLQTVAEQLAADTAVGPPDDVLLWEARGRFDRAVAALDAAPDAAPEARAEVAMAIAAVGTSLVDAAPGLVDPERLPRFVALARTHPDPPPGWGVRLAVVDAARVAVGRSEPERLTQQADRRYD